VDTNEPAQWRRSGLESLNDGHEDMRAGNLRGIIDYQL
jgi:hypothetical protein